jgi:hypothetical protein
VTWHIVLRHYKLSGKNVLLRHSKGQLKLKEDWCDVDSPKKRSNDFVLFFAVKSKKAKKQTNLFVCLLGESTAHQSAYSFI